MTEADHAHGDAQDRFMHEGGAFVAQAQAAKALEPGKGAFDHVAVHAQAAAVFLASFGQKGNDAFAPEPFAVGLAVVGTVRQHGLGFVLGVAWLARHRRHGFDESFELGHVMAVGARGMRGQGDAGAIGQEMILGAFTASVGGCFARLVSAAQRPQGRGVSRRRLQSILSA